MTHTRVNVFARRVAPLALSAQRWEGTGLLAITASGAVHMTYRGVHHVAIRTLPPPARKETTPLYPVKID
jgi:hypothetical protein